MSRELNPRPTDVKVTLTSYHSDNGQKDEVNISGLQHNSHHYRHYPNTQQETSGPASIVKTGVAAEDMKATVEAMAAGGRAIPVKTEAGKEDTAGAAAGANAAATEGGGGGDDDDDDSPARESELRPQVLPSQKKNNEHQ